MATRSPRRRAHPGTAVETSTRSDPEPLSRSQLRELKRRLRDLQNPTRFLLASVSTERFVLYYNISNDTFGMNDPSLGTLFKRRAAAVVFAAQRVGVFVIAVQHKGE